MFNSMYKWYSRKSPTVEKDKYNQNIITYAPNDDVEMFISLLTHYDNTSSNLKIKDCTHLALTNDESVEVDDIIDGNLRVEFMNKAGRDIMVYLKEVDNDGTYDR